MAGCVVAGLVAPAQGGELVNNQQRPLGRELAGPEQLALTYPFLSDASGSSHGQVGDLPAEDAMPTPTGAMLEGSPKVWPGLTGGPRCGSRCFAPRERPESW